MTQAYSDDDPCLNKRNFFKRVHLWPIFYDSRVVIYERKMFIRLATARKWGLLRYFKPSENNKLNL